MKVYDLYAPDGHLEATGTAAELGEMYYVNEAAIRYAARTGHKLLREYPVVENGKAVSQKKRRKCEIIANLHNKGLNNYQISVTVGLCESTVRKYLKEMKDAGVIT